MKSVVLSGLVNLALLVLWWVGFIVLPKIGVNSPPMADGRWLTTGWADT